ncbi:hypothetical protein BGX26_004603 [Mortierella sp. AD094]|nr:hypothetical protein BGX26_004603 [Mortierella sp. AD094]
MAPIASLIIVTVSLLGSMAAPSPISPATSPSVAQLNTTYTGFINSYAEHRNACPEISYSADEPVAIISAAMFGSIEDGTSACGKYVKISPQGNPSEHHTFKVVDICSECGETSLGLSNVAMAQLANISTAAIDWKLTEADRDVEHEIVKRKVNNKRGVFRGRGTWFSDRTGSCGIKFSQKDMIVALNEAQMGRMWGKGSKCGQRIRVKARGSSRSVTVKVVDTCPHRFCSHGQLDLSQAAFKKFAPMSKGILDLEWTFV